MTKKIDLSWFDLNNYKSLEHFDLAQWINVLGFRMRLNYLLKEKNGDYSDEEISQINSIISTIRNSPLLSPFEEFSAGGSIDSSFSFNTCSVRSTSLYMLAKISEDCRLKDWVAVQYSNEDIDEDIGELISNLLNFETAQEARDFIDSNPSIKTKGVTKDFLRSIEGPVNSDSFIPVDLIFHKNPSLGDISFTSVLVDLSSSDEQISKDFLYWLENYRRETGYYAPKRNFTEKKFNEWITMQLLPYIDLTLIALHEGTSITQYKLGSLLFPDDIEIDGTERIRRTVKPKANWLLEDSTLLAMQSQVNSSYPT